MKIAVFGVGAMGSIYAGLLAEAGHEVHAIDPWQAHIDAIKANGLQIEGASGHRIVKSLRASSSADSAVNCNLYVVATKISGVGEAASQIASLMSQDSLVLTIQNGLGSNQVAAKYLPSQALLIGVAEGFGATVRNPGHVYHSGMNLIRLGEIEGGISVRLEFLVKVWSDAGFNVKAFANINQLLWEKFLCNVTFSAPCTVFGCTLGELMEDKAMWRIAKGCALEAYELALANGISFAFDDLITYVTEFGARMPDARPSMLLDHHAGRYSEIDAINGMVVTLGDKLGVATPYNETLSTIIRRREAKFQRNQR